MRALGALLLVGCAQQSHHPAVDGGHDGPPDLASCSSAGGTANLVARMVGPAKVYGRLFAGGISLGGAVNATEPPFALSLVFANESPISADTGICCGTPTSTCCGIDTVSAQVQDLPNGGELGSHTTTVTGTDFTAMGTLTITDWIHPFDTPPGHIAGSLSVTTATVTIDGTFDNVFCPGMVGATI
jgi:hypothetical protein